MMSLVLNNRALMFYNLDLEVHYVAMNGIEYDSSILHCQLKDVPANSLNIHKMQTLTDFPEFCTV